MKTNNIILITVIIFVTALLRLVPFIDNFNPFTSIALFGAAYLSKKQWAYIIPLAAIYMSDFLLNNTILRGFYPNHEGIVFFSDYMISVYASYVLIVLFGKFIFRKVTMKNVILGILGSTLIFYLGSNIGAWLSPVSIYPQTASGLITALIAALPFVKMSFVSNIIFSTLLFGAYHLINSKVFNEKYSLQ